MTRQPVLIYGLMVSLLLLTLGWSLATGSRTLPLPVLTQWLNTGEWSGIWQTILWEIRWPRALMAMLIGAGLGLAGTALQAIFRNPLAEPSVLGISSGATAFALATMVMLPGLYAALNAALGTLTLPSLAALGAVLTLTLLLLLGRHHAWEPNRIILIGLSLNVLAGALLGFSAYWSTDQQLRILSFWSLGSLSGATNSRALVTGLIMVPAAAVLLRQWRFLNALLLGESEAHHLGFRVARHKRFCFLAVALIAGVAVSFSGIIGFVGLVVPHIMRLLFGPGHRHLMWHSILGGAIFLLLADTLARALLAPLDLPVGLLTALVGAPALIVLLNRREVWHPTR